MQTTSESISFFPSIWIFIYFWGFFFFYSLCFSFLFCGAIPWKGKTIKMLLNTKWSIMPQTKYHACGLCVKKVIHQQEILSVSFLRVSFFLPLHFCRIFCLVSGLKFFYLEKFLHENLFSGYFPNTGEIFYFYFYYFFLGLGFRCNL